MKKTYQTPAMQNIMLPSLLKAPQNTSSISSGGDDGGDGVGQSKGFVFGESLWDEEDTTE